MLVIYCFKDVAEADNWIQKAKDGKIKDKDGNFLPKVKFVEATPQMKQMLKKRVLYRDCKR